MAAAAAVARFLKRAAWPHARSRPWWPALIAVVVTLAALAAPAHERLNLLAYDLLAPTQPARSDLVLVAIDEASIARLGQWPWPRSLHARMIERLRGAGASAAGYAVLFSEPQAGAAGLASDQALADALTRWGHVVLPVAPVRDPSGAMSELEPLPSLAQAARLGHVDFEVDADGVVRSLFLMGGVRRELPAFALALAESAHFETGRRELPGRRAGVQERSAPGVWQRDHEVLLPRARPARPDWSFADALESGRFADAVRGRAVLVGVTARGLGPEFFLARVGGASTSPSVYLHALAYDAWRDDAFITPASVLGCALFTLAVLAATLALWPRGSARWQQALLAASVLLPLAVSWSLLRMLDTWWGPAPAMLGLAAACLACFTSRLNAATRSVQRAERDAKATLESIGDAVFNLDERRLISYLNPPARTLSALSEPIGHTVAEAFAFDADSALRLEDTVRGSLEARDVLRISEPLLLHPQDRHTRALSATVAPLLNERGQGEGVVIALGDLTEAVASARRLSHAATHDLLTGLPNRGLVLDRLQQGIARALRGGSGLAVLFMDLDRFKRINDSLGHHVGDEVLRATGQRLLATCRVSDTVGRWGGDEFVVVIEDVAEREAVGTVVGKIVDALSQPMQLDSIAVPCSCSVGIALAPDDSVNANELLAMADGAMYRAKAQAAARFHFYSNELNRWTRDRLTLELDLRQGLARGEFELHYQPQIELASGRTIGLEALLRWRRPDGSLVLPAQFITLAEECGLIVELGEWVVRTAAAQLLSWLAQGLPVVPVAVNVSARQCADRRIVDVVRDVLEQSALDPGLLCLEITESIAMADFEHAVSLFDELAALGVQISVDDFGTGYSSLSRLKRFSVHELKIDRSFIQHMTTDTEDAAIVLATIALGVGLGLRVVAEGVETASQQHFLARHGCEAAQGFLYSKAVPAAQVELLIRQPSEGFTAASALSPLS